MNKKRAMEIIEDENKKTWRRPDELFWQIAICQIMVGNVQEAYKLFRESFLASLKPPMHWSRSAQPNHLAYVYFLSCEFDYKTAVIKNLFEYRKKERIGENYYAQVAYAIMGLQYPELDWTTKSLTKLQSSPDLKDTYSIGLCVQALEQNDQSGFDNGLTKLLDAHKGMAVHGGLRDTPEGGLCMPAMVLIYLAKLRGMKIELENKYVSQEYIDFIISPRKSPGWKWNWLFTN
jgi:hypothetical protein